MMTVKDRGMIGQRVELHPALDRWMMGDRFGTIVGQSPRLTRKFGQTVWRVKMDISGKTLRVVNDNLARWM